MVAIIPMAFPLTTLALGLLKTWVLYVRCHLHCMWEGTHGS